MTSVPHPAERRHDQDMNRARADGGRQAWARQWVDEGATLEDRTAGGAP